MAVFATSLGMSLWGLTRLIRVRRKALSSASVLPLRSHSHAVSVPQNKKEW
jgi:hypothetical protein